ncbi:hypothetical protein [Domibacillus tundrae]|uniref:hypothetical protein n=1 Tax=Domibacillus tundrae TaxID=1587527 RepID=UPI0012E038F9|nr:hypothetical protein [Domibacillus tundrae]
MEPKCGRVATSRSAGVFVASPPPLFRYEHRMKVPVHMDMLRWRRRNGTVTVPTRFSRIKARQKTARTFAALPKNGVKQKERRLLREQR